MRPLKEILSGKDEGTGMRISKTTALLILFCVLLVFITAGVTARYMQKTENSDVAVAKEFYFTSDLLDGKEHTIAPTDSGGTGSVTITLMNHADELRYSEVDIEYSISVAEVTDGNGAASSNNDAPTVTYNSGEKIASGKCNNATVTISNLTAGKTYTVKATTNNTYSKTLTGTIKVNAADSALHASVTDKTQYIEVNVWSVDEAHDSATLTYCDGLIPDNTDSLMSGAQTAATGLSVSISEIELAKNESHMFRFFKTDISAKYDASVNGSTVTISRTNSGTSSDTSSETTAS